MNSRKGEAAVVVILVLVLGGLVYWQLAVHRPKQAADLQKKLSNAIETVQTESEKAGLLPKSFPLEIVSPADKAIVSTAMIEVAGKTMPGAEVFVNDVQTRVDKNGDFRQKVTLQEGENLILVSAGNDTGDTEVERTVYYELP